MNIIVNNSSSLPMSPRVGAFFTKIFPWLFILIGAACLFFGAKTILDANASTKWPSTEGVVINSSVDSRSGKKSKTYHADVLYEFSVNGASHKGNRVAYGDYGSSDSSHAQGIVNKYPKGARVSVYYKPDSPSDALLETGIHGQTWALPIFGLLFMSAGVALLKFMTKVNPSVTSVTRT